jgi:hypothetical protein
MKNLVQSVLLLLVIAVAIIWGSISKDKNEKDHLQFIQQFKVAPEFIKTRDLQVPTDYQSVTGYKYPTVNNYWVTAQTAEWALLNGPRGTALCQSVLGNFAEVNANSEVMSSASLQLIASGFKDKTIELEVHIPRFKTEPFGIEKCVGFSYDAVTGTLMVGDKHVAYLDATQPRLAQAQPGNSQTTK